MAPRDANGGSAEADGASTAGETSARGTPARGSSPRGTSAAGVTSARRDAYAIDGEAAEGIFDALSSETARAILARLHERPRTPSEIGDVVDSSLQNVGHHLDQLGAVDLVEVVGTEHSAQGREMNVYAPTAAGLVLYAGDEPPRTDPPASGPGPSAGAAPGSGRPGRDDGWPAPPVSFALGALAGSAAATLWRSLRR